MSAPINPAPTTPAFSFISSSKYLEQPGRAHSAAHAHRHDGVAHAAAPALEQRVTDEPRPGHAVRMPDGNPAAIDVQALGIDAETLLAVDHLDGEGLVELPESDVVDRQAV